MSVVSKVEARARLALAGVFAAALLVIPGPARASAVQPGWSGVDQ